MEVTQASRKLPPLPSGERAGVRGESRGIVGYVRGAKSMVCTHQKSFPGTLPLTLTLSPEGRGDRPIAGASRYVGWDENPSIAIHKKTGISSRPTQPSKGIA
jgi:hypothetical protein